MGYAVFSGFGAKRNRLGRELKAFRFDFLLASFYERVVWKTLSIHFNITDSRRMSQAFVVFFKENLPISFIKFQDTGFYTHV
ncbi:hypothetical protein UZ36_02310 [Candidatus Nitromaritima sp. SCGC AAA799-C22]|nr:hypothetical protein UZ36_02310 [Candidatus Nitromaritima sp. SCGC AAA799-C22]